MTNTLSLHSTVVATSQQVSCEFADEAVILNLKDSIYYGLNEVGVAIWSQIQTPCTVAEVRDRVLREFEVENERCERDVLALLERLTASGLVDVCHVAA